MLGLHLVSFSVMSEISHARAVSFTAQVSRDFLPLSPSTEHALVVEAGKDRTGILAAIILSVSYHPAAASVRSSRP